MKSCARRSRYSQTTRNLRRRPTRPTVSSRTGASQRRPDSRCAPPPAVPAPSPSHSEQEERLRDNHTATRTHCTPLQRRNTHPRGARRALFPLRCARSSSGGCVSVLPASSAAAPGKLLSLRRTNFLWHGSTRHFLDGCAPW